ncbi:ATP-binding protein [Gemmatimonas aurantiaca]|uniref:ATP-binding protein n=1 Tax=Gemmatimonas aurantiaca TaxID=173480 RepID=UPI00301B89A2
MTLHREGSIPVRGEAASRMARPFETEALRLATARVLNAHQQHGFIVMSGPPGVGKTTCAHHLVSLINEDDALGVGVQADTFEVSGKRTRPSSHQSVRGPLRELYARYFGTLPSTLFQRDSEHAVTRRVVATLRQRGLQVLLLDEAGTYAAEELRGLSMLLNISREESWPLTVVLIGMDDIAKTVESLPQITSRVVRWIWFEPLNREDWEGIYSVIVPRLSRAKHRAIRSWTWKICGGSARALDKLLVEVVGRAGDSEIPLEEVTLDFVKAVHEDMEEEWRMVRTRGRLRTWGAPSADGDDVDE